jgi:hypothetical protein
LACKLACKLAWACERPAVSEVSDMAIPVKVLDDGTTLYHAIGLFWAFCA